MCSGCSARLNVGDGLMRRTDLVDGGVPPCETQRLLSFTRLIAAVSLAQ